MIPFIRFWVWVTLVLNALRFCACLTILPQAGKPFYSADGELRRYAPHEGIFRSLCYIALSVSILYFF